MNVFGRLFRKHKKATPQELGAMMFHHTAFWIDFALKQRDNKNVPPESEVASEVFAQEITALFMFASDYAMFQLLGKSEARRQAVYSLRDACATQGSQHRVPVIAQELIDQRAASYAASLRQHATSGSNPWFAIGLRFAGFCGCPEELLVAAPVSIMYGQSVNAAMKVLGELQIGMAAERGRA